jgi:hypothetical protein
MSLPVSWAISSAGITTLIAMIVKCLSEACPVLC